MATADWWRHGVIYQIYPRSFADANGDGVGDLAGITSRLDHLNDGTPGSLGVDAIWLSPFYPSPMADFGYDVADFCDVDPLFGTLSDFDQLLAGCHARGIKLVMDLVVNHTSDEHPWFVSARSSPDSPYRDWYVWSETEPPHAEEGVVFPGYQRGTWSHDEVAKLWYHHRFYAFQPDLNWNNPAVREEIGRIVAFWLQLGVSGFRMDGAPFVIEEVHPDSAERTMHYEWLEDLRDLIGWRRGDATVLAEANVPREQILDRRPVCLGSHAFDPRVGGQVRRRAVAPPQEPVPRPAEAARGRPRRCVRAGSTRDTAT